MEGKSEASFWEFKVSEKYVEEWFMMGSPYIVLSVLVSYLFFVLKCGPKFMENRPAYKLRTLLIIYNAFQVAFSAYLFNIGLEVMFNYGIIENGCCAYDDKQFKHKMLSSQYLYFIAKFTELLDTVFFVLRKKTNQVTFLHVYHHSVMFLVTWAVLKYEPSFSLIFLGIINSFVHLIMYGYYGLSAFPDLQSYLWWKKYITKLQLIQFMMVLVQVTVNFYVTTCPTSYFILTFTWSHLVLFIFLFTRFYFKSYTEKNRNKQNVKEQKKHDNGTVKRITELNGNKEQIKSR